MKIKNQLKFLSLFLIGIICKTEAEDGNKTIVNLPICVVGAGLSGLGLGSILQRKGQNVQIYEQDGRVGGKVFTYRQGDQIQVEMCPIVYGLWQTSLMSYIRAHHLTSVPMNQDMTGYDVDTGELFPIPSPTNPEVAAITNTVLRYIDYRSRYDFRFGYLNAHPDLFVTTFDWLTSRDLGLLIPVFRIIVTMEGYGALEDVPALYSLKFVDKALLLAKLTNSPKVVNLKDGLDVLVNKMAEHLNVHVNHTAVGVTRGQGHPVLTTMSPLGERRDHNCSKIVLAFPPLLKNLEKVMNLTEEERNIFGQVRINIYTSAATSIPSLNNSLYIQATRNVTADNVTTVTPSIEGHGEPMLFAKQNFKKRPNMFVGYSWIRGPVDQGASPETLASIERQLQQLLNRWGNDTTTFYRKNADYFPHVGTEALRDGFYKKLDAIQGRGGIYYATTILDTECMDGALKTSEGIAHQYLSP